MSRTRVKKQTKHGIMRFKERCSSIPAKNMDSFIKSASKHGFSPAHFPESPFKHYLLAKQRKNNKRIKIYKDFIFIFNSTSNGLITMYRIPENYIDTFKQFMKNNVYLNTKSS